MTDVGRLRHDLLEYIRVLQDNGLALLVQSEFAVLEVDFRDADVLVMLSLIDQGVLEQVLRLRDFIVELLLEDHLLCVERMEFLQEGQKQTESNSSNRERDDG
jgi:hypothetical protein